MADRKNMKNNLSILFLLAIFSAVSNGQTIADCKNPDGYAYYHHNFDKNKKNEFEKDKILGGMLSIVKLKDKTYDLVVVDSRKK